MKNKKMLLAILCCGSMFLSACGGDTSSETQKENQASPPDLTGEWRQINSNSEDSWQSATIIKDTITVYWVSDNGDTKSLYWAGSFDAPTTTETPYSWDSVNDTEQTSTALLASGDETKSFTYDGEQISYEVSAMGITTTVKLEKQ